jgi:hypothetical protein
MQSSPREHRQLERNLSEVRDRERPAGNIFNKAQQLSNNPERPVENYKLPSISQNNDKLRAESNLGSNMGNMPRENIGQRRKGFERFQVYERQQKPYNIISCYPK